MNVIGNIIWFILGGFLPGLLMMVVGLLLCVSIVGIPAGLKSFRKGFDMFMPFGRTVEVTHETKARGYMVLNVVWLVLFGWILILFHLILGAALAVTIIGIPFAMQHFKMMPESAMPYSHDLVQERVKRVRRKSHAVKKTSMKKVKHKSR